MENKCPHYDYGKSADKCMGAYCTAKKKLVEPEDCEGCDNHRQRLWYSEIAPSPEMPWPTGCEEGEEE